MPKMIDLARTKAEKKEESDRWGKGITEDQPHISSYIDLATVEAYQGKIILGPEIFEEVQGG